MICFDVRLFWAMCAAAGMGIGIVITTILNIILTLVETRRTRAETDRLNDEIADLQQWAEINSEGHIETVMTLEDEIADARAQAAKFRAEAEAIRLNTEARKAEWYKSHGDE